MTPTLTEERSLNEILIDAVLGTIFKNSDSSDEPEQTWLDGHKFYEVSVSIVAAIQLALIEDTSKEWENVTNS